MSENTAFAPLFHLGNPNDAFAQYFSGNSYIQPLAPAVANVTFAPGCRNNWHIHHASKGGGQILLCTDGEGWYQEWRKPAQALRPGDAVTIPAGVKHWHGAAEGQTGSPTSPSPFPAEDTSNEWLEPVSDAEYDAL